MQGEKDKLILIPFFYKSPKNRNKIISTNPAFHRGIPYTVLWKNMYTICCAFSIIWIWRKSWLFLPHLPPCPQMPYRRGFIKLWLVCVKSNFFLLIKIFSIKFFFYSWQNFQLILKKMFLNLIQFFLLTTFQPKDCIRWI